MSNPEEQDLFVAEAIRDTSDHMSEVSVENYGSQTRTLLIHNKLDESVSIQVQGDRESTFSNPMDIGSAIVVSANTNEYTTMTQYFPFIRIKATCSVAPTTGSLSSWIERGF